MSDKTRPLILEKNSALARAVEAIRAGGVVAYPTETFYALGVDPFNSAAVERLLKLKVRPDGKPISLIIKDACVLRTITPELSTVVLKLSRAFWPGPLTIVLRAVESIPEAITAGSGSVGVRVSSSPVAGRFAAELSTPITATSANPAGAAPPVTAKEVIDFFGSSIDVIIDGGTLPGAPASTVVDATGAKPEILRAGTIGAKEIEAVL
ncbi:MAG: threonylcarbamoyl-AMP synthase [Proteobacteria bacterium]|nr:threonylcarbamoyl-AMP synthase [Pseudomonadota bacterium]